MGSHSSHGSGFRELFDIFHHGGGESPAPVPPPPDPAKATNDALNSQLQNELNIRRSMALVTGGQGVTPTPQTLTAGQRLMGA